MQNLFNQFSQVLGITLLHSLWQGLIIYALLRLLFMCVPSASAGSKYNITLFGLAASVIWPVITLFMEIGKHPVIQQISNYTADGVAFIPAHATIPFVNPAIVNSYTLTIAQYMPYIVAIWLTGVVVNAIRLILGWQKTYYIKQSVVIDHALSKLTPSLALKLNIKKHIGVFVSEYIDVPCMVGYLKPMIILPMSVASQFSAAQIESILIHEMAHIRNNDYLINAIQQVVGIVFFFNPFTHLINRIIYNEREHNCDDLVLQLTGQPLIYAQTLLQLEESRQHNWQLALAATGKKYELLNRIKRIMETKKQVNNIRHILAAVLLLIGSMGTIAWLNPEIKDGKVTVTPIKNFRSILSLADTVKKSRKAKTTTVLQRKAVFPKPIPVSQKKNVYNSGNPVLDKLSEDITRHSNALQAYYNSAQYQYLQKQIDASSAIIDSFYNKPELKKLQEKMDAQTAEFDKLSNAPEINELMKKTDEMSKAQSDFFENATYKKLQANFDEQSKWFERESAAKSPDFKAHSEALEKAGAALRTYTGNPQRKADEQLLITYNKQINEYYHSPDYEKQRDAMRETQKAMRIAYQNPLIKQQQVKLGALGKQVREFQNRPEVKKEKALLNEANKRYIAYTNNPAFKKLQEEREKNRNAMQRSYSNQADTSNNGGK